MSWRNLCGVLLLGSALALQAAAPRIIKVLPHHLDKQGRHTLSPSLYERDAYQAQLRQHPEQRSALRFDIQWKARAVTNELVLRIEGRGAQTGGPVRQVTVEKPVKPTRTFARWTALTIEGDSYKTFGELVAWRASLWSGGQMLAEHRSFLW